MNKGLAFPFQRTEQCFHNQILALRKFESSVGLSKVCWKCPLVIFLTERKIGAFMKKWTSFNRGLGSARLMVGLNLRRLPT